MSSGKYCLWVKLPELPSKARAINSFPEQLTCASELQSASPVTCEHPSRSIVRYSSLKDFDTAPIVLFTCKHGPFQALDLVTSACWSCPSRGPPVFVVSRRPELLSIPCQYRSLPEQGFTYSYH